MADANYSWEGNVERSWEELEDVNNELSNSERAVALERARKRQQPDVSHSVRRGMIRYFYVIIDMSSAMNQTDLKPHRLSVTLSFLNDFMQLYFDQNPLSQIGFICTLSEPTFIISHSRPTRQAPEEEKQKS
jgi:transcription initiation factor TFIIH subunit 2